MKVRLKDGLLVLTAEQDNERMDGGIDLAYRNHFGLGLQTRLQHVIELKWNGFLPEPLAWDCAYRRGCCC